MNSHDILLEERAKFIFIEKRLKVLNGNRVANFREIQRLCRQEAALQERYPDIADGLQESDFEPTWLEE
jgi:hypothetical protein